MSICISRGIKGTSSQSWTGLESSVFFLDDLECCSNTLILKMSLTCQILLISICAFFHLAPGDAMKCHACSALNESGPCEPVEDCEIDENEACSATKVYEVCFAHGSTAVFLGSYAPGACQEGQDVVDTDFSCRTHHLTCTGYVSLLLAGIRRTERPSACCCLKKQTAHCCPENVQQQQKCNHTLKQVAVPSCHRPMYALFLCDYDNEKKEGLTVHSFYAILSLFVVNF
ncbi:uncharacterized protein LOC134296458 isoform X1 [Anolis carolinensis]|uniref:uncharacterized protein LOC134296458 isoform X1 n=1 Tax=Anolis carolinensis TaxID=28377 RepID=UPI002F2B2834